MLNEVAPANRIYARARSDYIHPLYGLNGEVLTRDWPVDHPHHRGIYWAWPEVDYGTNRGDLHALQKVFARPTGRVRLANGRRFAEVEGREPLAVGGPRAHCAGAGPHPGLPGDRRGAGD